MDISFGITDEKYVVSVTGTGGLHPSGVRFVHEGTSERT